MQGAWQSVRSRTCIHYITAGALRPEPEALSREMRPKRAPKQLTAKPSAAVNAAYVRYLIIAMWGVGAGRKCNGDVLANFSVDCESHRERGSRAEPRSHEVARSLSLSFSRNCTLSLSLSLCSPALVYAAGSTCAPYFSAHSMLVLRPVWFTVISSLAASV